MIMNLANQPVLSYTKDQQTKSKRIKRTQRQRGAISPHVRQDVRERSKGLCEIRKRCNGAQAVEQAHLQGRRLIESTTPDMLRDVCKECHIYLDESVEGIRLKKQLRG
jgi:hypothetical protein